LRKAINCLDEATAIVPANWQALLLRGKALQTLGEHEEALMTFPRAQECDSTQVMVAVELGATAGRVGQHDRAVRVMEAVAREHPDDPRLPVNLGCPPSFCRISRPPAAPLNERSNLNRNETRIDTCRSC
jgi:Flp pilus assembly protein TadD